MEKVGSYQDLRLGCQSSMWDTIKWKAIIEEPTCVFEDITTTNLKESFQLHSQLTCLQKLTKHSYVTTLFHYKYQDRRYLIFGGMQHLGLFLQGSQNAVALKSKCAEDVIQLLHFNTKECMHKTTPHLL